MELTQPPKSLGNALRRIEAGDPAKRLGWGAFNFREEHETEKHSQANANGACRPSDGAGCRGVLRRGHKPSASAQETHRGGAHQNQRKKKTDRHKKKHKKQQHFEHFEQRQHCFPKKAGQKKRTPHD